MRYKSQVVYFPRKLFSSNAFQKLSGTAVKVLVIFYTKRVIAKIPKSKGSKDKEFICVNNGKITFYYSEAQKKYGISRKAFSRAIDELFELGFIDIARPGIGRYRIPSLYSISERWLDFGTPQFKELKRTKRLSYRRFSKSQKET